MNHSIVNYANIGKQLKMFVRETFVATPKRTHASKYTLPYTQSPCIRYIKINKQANK